MPPHHKAIIAQSAELIYDGFRKYNDGFKRITDRARRRFEEMDWAAHQQDIVDRVDLYEQSVCRLVLTLRKQLGHQVNDHRLWHDIRWYFGERVENVPDSGFMKTFFNSTSRRIFNTTGTDPEVEFVSPAPDEGFNPMDSLTLNRYPHWGLMQVTCSKILKDYAFEVPYHNLAADVMAIGRQLDDFHQSDLDEFGDILRFEFIDSAFFQSARAYLIGRIIQQDKINPIVIALKNDKNGISVDAVLLSEEQVSIVFSYTRSYYFANPHSVIGAVHFLHSILPEKPIDELYTVLGRLRQGKTERYRIFSHHLNHTDDKFVHAAGDKGLVMIVFTLPCYNLVFKIIRDRFGYPKTISRADVLDKYKLVSKHDRAGRLIDTQEFRNLAFPTRRFAAPLLEELISEAKDTVTVAADKVIIDHVYIERRVRPLNLYIREASKPDAEQAIIDYGMAIRELAATNIFPGDLLLKNFGVTRHRRVVFYDYDEVALVTECKFRELPNTKDEADIMRSESWFHVNTNDIFPEEFIKFLALDDHLCKLFLTHHADLLTADYWRKMKKTHLQGQVSMIIPYARHAARAKTVMPDRQAS